MIRIYTTFEQAKALVDAGLDPRTADLSYDSYAFDNNGEHPLIMRKPSGEYDLPCWSCARLMALLPDEIIIHETGKYRRHYKLEVSKFEPWQYAVNYVFGFYPDEEVLHETYCMDSPTDALVEMLVWVMQNGYEDKEVQHEIAEKE